MIRVLFVCLGNICRSPMAEAVFRHIAKEEGVADRIEVDSAGTGDWHIGRPPHHGTQHILTAKQISYEGIRARQVQTEDFARFDYIIAMDDQNVRDLESIRKLASTGKGEKPPFVGKLLDFAKEGTVRDVPDPYYTGNFDEVYNMVEDGCRGLLNYIMDKESL